MVCEGLAGQGEWFGVLPRDLTERGRIKDDLEVYLASMMC